MHYDIILSPASYL